GAVEYGGGEGRRRWSGVGTAGTGSGGGGEERRAVADRARHRVLDHQTAEDVAVNRPERIAAARGLEPEEPAAGRRDADRAPAVVGVSHRDQAGGDSRGRSTARAPGRPAGVPGIARGAEESRLGRRKNPELGRIGLADH